MDRDRLRWLGTASAVAGAGLLVASVFRPWTATGVGSTISGRELGDLLLSGTVGRWVPRWGGVALYLQPICAGVLLVGLGLGGRLGRGLVLGAVAVAWLGALLVAATLAWRPLTDPGSGALLLGAGLVLASAGVLVRRRADAPAAAGSS